MPGQIIRERPVLTALIGAASVVAASAIGVLAANRGGPDEQRTPSPPPTVTAPADPISRLLSYLPDDTVSACAPADTPLGALAKVRCKATPATGHVDTDIHFALYDGLASSRRAFEQVVPADIPVSNRVCPDGPDRSDYTLPGGGKGGLLACYVDSRGNVPHIVWTRDAPGIMAEAVAPAGAKLSQLWDVWLTVPINRSPTPSSVTTTG